MVGEIRRTAEDFAGFVLLLLLLHGLPVSQSGHVQRVLAVCKSDLLLAHHALHHHYSMLAWLLSAELLPPS